jgi:glutamyl-tRNA synthetase
MKKLSDYKTVMEFFLKADVTPSVADLVPKKSTPDAAKKMLDAAREALTPLPEWTALKMEYRIREAANALGVKERDIFMTLRVAVTGTPVSPPLFESMEVLGRDKCLARIQGAVARLT